MVCVCALYGFPCTCPRDHRAALRKPFVGRQSIPPSPLLSSCCRSFFVCPCGNKQAGELKSAVGELEKLKGLPAEVAKDWLKDAKVRLTADEVRRCLFAFLFLSTHVFVCLAFFNSATLLVELMI